MPKGNVCDFCNVVFDTDDMPPCGTSTEANECMFNKPAKPPLRVVGQEDDAETAAARLDALKQLIRNGAAWCMEPWLALAAEDHIARGLCKPPRSKAARERRRLWHQRRAT